MTTINQLSTIETLQGADLVPVYSSSNGDARKASMTTVKNFVSDALQTQIAQIQDEINALEENIGAGDASLVGYQAVGSGSVLRNVGVKLNEFISVKDFGAVGDGVTDDTTAIQNAINAANSLGKSVLVNATTESYLCGPLNVTTCIYGENAKSSKLKRKTFTTGPWLNILSHRVTVNGLYLDGNYVAARCIEVDGFDDVSISNNIARQIGEYFVHFNNADRLIIEANNYKDGANGISNLMPVDSVSAVGSVDVKIVGNHVGNIVGTGIHIAGKQSSSDPLFAWTNPLIVGCVIANNTIRDCQGHGIIGQGYSVTVDSNSLIGCGAAGGLQSIVCQGRYITVCGNVVEGGDGVGIDMGLCSYSTVDGNSVRNQQEIGIELQSCISVACSDNSIVDCGSASTGDASAGIAVLQGFFGPSNLSINNVVTGNVVISSGSSGDYGVSVGAGVNKVLVSGNNLILSGSVAPLYVSATANAFAYGNMTAANEEDLFSVYGDNPKFASRNASGNADFWMVPQGTGTLRLQKYFSNATTPANFVAEVTIPIKDQDGNVFYIPAKFGTPW